MSKQNNFFLTDDFLKELAREISQLYSDPEELENDKVDVDASRMNDF